MIHICSHCGALLLDDADKCSFCDALLVEQAEASESIAIGVAAPVARAAISAHQSRHNTLNTSDTEWRREVARRLHEYRVRRGRLDPNEPQSGLPFAEEPVFEEDGGVEERRPIRPVQRQRQSERVEICIQPELDFSTSPDYRAHPQTALVPVAGLNERRRAGALDAVFLALTYAGFLGLFRSLGGQLMLEKVDAIVHLSVFYLFYAQYFFLFTTFAGATPGMQLRGLNIVRLDGSLPDTRQLLWRSFGYLLSGATLMLGFLWSLWDEDRFTWQDRISQTYITAAAPVMDMGALEVPVHPSRHRFAHK